MQKFYTDTDNQLRQLENQSLPDLSRQDEHWQGMKKILQPGVVPSKPVSRIKLWHWLVAACVIGGLCFMVYNRQNNNSITESKKTIAGIKDTGAVEIKVVRGKISSPVVAEEKIPAIRIIWKTVKTKLPEKVTVKKIIENKGWIIPILSPDTAVVTAATDPAESKAILASFFNQMEKPSQQFVIDNKRDTVIWGNDGSALFIAANTFATKEPVTIFLKEYYSYEDIVTNKLTTFSNGKQLITGGMIHLTAIANGKELSMLSGKSIRWFIPDTTSAMNNMEVFKGEKNNGPDWTAGTYSDEDGGNTGWMWASDINWVPQKQNFNRNYLYTSVKVVDLRDHPYRSRETKKGRIGKFHISTDTKVSKEEMEKMLKEKYGYYKVIIKEVDDIRSKSYRRSLFGRWYTSKWESSEELGDSAWVDIKVAQRYRLVAKDTMISRTPSPADGQYEFLLGSRRSRGQILSPLDSSLALSSGAGIFDPAFSNKNLTGLAKKYSVDISSLGWVNCDRFYNDNRPKIDYYVDLNDTATNYYTLLVFDKIRSMMTGSVNGNKVVFRNVPLGEMAKVISVSVKDGKPISAMESVKLSKNMLKGLKFEETTPSKFKEQAGTMDK